MRISRLISAASLIVIAGAAEARAQDISRRIAAVRDGTVRMTFAARPDICGNGNSISRGPNQRFNWSSSNYSADVEYDSECSRSPVRLVLEVDDGKVTKVRTYVGGRWRPAPSGTADLGAVPVRAATDYLLGLAASADGSAGRDAILPATLADSVVVWQQLLRIARDGNRPSETRKQAIFWVGQAAGEKITGGLTSVANDDDIDTEVKKQAVFALSQRRNGEAVPALIQIARSNRDPEVRKSALFWLGQSKDPRAISLFEEILTR